jgi:putative ABC transport system substrate-binding protein
MLITVLLLLTPATGWCYDLLIVQSQRSPVYDEVLRGFRSRAHFSERIIVLTDSNDIDLVRIAREENPLVIVTLGDKALAAARKVRQIPVIALMAISFRGDSNQRAAITGVEIQSPPKRYMALFTALKVRKVGIIVATSQSIAYVKQARKSATAKGIELIVREVKTSKEVASQLATLNGLVDSLWLLPDTISSSGEAADTQFLFAVSHKIPVVTFSSAYLAFGASVALDFDRFDIGRQAGDMAVKLVDGDLVSAVPPEVPRKTDVKSNASVLRRLNLSLDPTDGGKP